jgi:hypothetical protein
MHLIDEGEENWKEMVLECWHLCHDLLRHAKKQIGNSGLALWRQQAAEDGVLEDYDYHLGMKKTPLPYKKWKMKFDSLNRIQNLPAYQDGRPLPHHVEEQANQLCLELGY